MTYNFIRSLLGEIAENENTENGPKEGVTHFIDVDDLIPSKDNIRTVDESLKESIELFGVLQPLNVRENNILTSHDVKWLKDIEDSNIEGRTETYNFVVEEGDDIETTEDKVDSESAATSVANAVEKEIKEAPQQEEFDPQPQSKPSLCWRCLHYTKCIEKGETVQSCNMFEDKNKQQEQQEQQETRESEVKAIEVSGVAEAAEPPQTEHIQHMDTAVYQDICSGKKSYIICVDNDYKDNDALSIYECVKGRKTGKTATMLITCISRGGKALKKGYCVLGVQIMDYSV